MKLVFHYILLILIVGGIHAFVSCTLKFPDEIGVENGNGFSSSSLSSSSSSYLETSNHSSSSNVNSSGGSSGNGLSSSSMPRNSSSSSSNIISSSANVVSSSAGVAYSNNLVDSRDGKTYKTVMIGTKVWMAENLNYAAGDRKCCGSPSSELACPYGILYGSAGDNCPKGWHLPSETDWNKLMGEAGGAKIAGGYFKATSDWNQNSAGQDVFGFAAMPGGYWTPAYGCQKVGYEGYWWSTSGCIFRMSSSDNEVQRITDYRADQYGRDYFSVRCVKD